MDKIGFGCCFFFRQKWTPVVFVAEKEKHMFLAFAVTVSIALCGVSLIIAVDLAKWNRVRSSPYRLLPTDIAISSRIMLIAIIPLRGDICGTPFSSSRRADSECPT